MVGAAVVVGMVAVVGGAVDAGFELVAGAVVVGAGPAVVVAVLDVVALAGGVVVDTVAGVLVGIDGPDVGADVGVDAVVDVAVVGVASTSPATGSGGDSERAELVVTESTATGSSSVNGSASGADAGSVAWPQAVDSSTAIRAPVHRRRVPAPRFATPLASAPDAENLRAGA